ncbi:hypothetical protein V8E36_004692 [Tilletia maclaganii]
MLLQRTTTTAFQLLAARSRPTSSTAHRLFATMAAPSNARNRLSQAKSPYLLSHSTNPVEWYEWGDSRAWQRAQAEQKLVLMSAGYHACHWCHVMAVETFEDEEAAETLNESFIAIKVDREERPDVDAAYMTFVQSIRGRGGWPLNVFLTPDGAPVYGLTYLPKHNFIALCNRLAQLWADDPERCIASANDIKEQLRHVVSVPPLASIPKANVVCRAAEHALREFDEVHGGFGDAPKFPQVSNTFQVLHRYAAGALDGSLLEAGATRSSALLAIERSAFTLSKIADGGITDHLGGGFARYSVDVEWRVPHFEKMLYDQAQLLATYAEAIQLARSSSDAKVTAMIPTFERALEGAITYLARDMTSSEGVFYSAEDADSPLQAGDAHGKEGAFYVWSHPEVVDVLGADTMGTKVVLSLYDITPEGNIPASSDPHGEFESKNMLHRAKLISDVARELDITVEEAQKDLDDAHTKLFEIRSKRVRPPLDDKLVTAWNGMVVSGLIKASHALSGRPAIAEKALGMAERALKAIFKVLWDESNGTLRRSWREGPGPEGTSLDYAAVIQALLDWFETTQEEKWLEKAVALQKKLDELFWDDEQGGYFISTKDSDGNRLMRMKETQDGAEPTALGLSAHNLARLLILLDADPEAEARRTQLERAIRSGGSVLERAPYAMGTLATAVQRLQCASDRIAIILCPEKVHARSRSSIIAPYLEQLHSRVLPFVSTIIIDASELEAARKSWLYSRNGSVKAALDDPRVEEHMRQGVVAHVCERGACGPPVRDPAEFGKQLEGRI